MQSMTVKLKPDTRLMDVFQDSPGKPVPECLAILDFVGVKDNGGGGDNWSHKMCNAPVKSSPSTNHHPTFYRPDVLPVTHPTASEHRMGKVLHSTDLLIPLAWRSSSLVFDH